MFEFLFNKEIIFAFRLPGQYRVICHRHPFKDSTVRIHPKVCQHLRRCGAYAEVFYQRSPRRISLGLERGDSDSDSVVDAEVLEKGHFYPVGTPVPPVHIAALLRRQLARVQVEPHTDRQPGQDYGDGYIVSLFHCSSIFLFISTNSS